MTADEEEIVDASDIEEEEKPSNEALASVADLALALQAKARRVEELTKALEEAQKEHAVIEQDQLPKAMAAIKMKDFTLEDGSKITIVHEHYPNISQANKPGAFAWLRKNKHGDIIKRTIQVAFGAGEEKVADKLVTYLGKTKTIREGAKVTDSTGVHASTLKAFVREQIAKRVQLPPEFGVHSVTRAVLNNPTGGKPVQRKDDEL